MKKYFYAFIFTLLYIGIANATLITINKNTKLWVQQYGHGKPTIILINGGGDTIDTEWTKIIPALSKTTSILAYDRPGQMKSTPLQNRNPVTAKSVVITLRTLLKKLRISPPYILVAHSSGALYAQYFARNYPKEVSGLVIINGNLVTEQFPETVQWLFPKMVKFINHYNNQHLKKLEDKLNQTEKNAKGNPTAQQIAQITYSLEVMGKQKSAKEIMQSPPLSKNLALAVLVSGTYPLEIELQKEFSEQVPNSIFKQFPNASHYIQNDDPKAVINIINQIVFRVKNTKEVDHEK
ncbi:MAG: alpha/beta hydrolase [Gammaproteobacteria bacterium]|nr:alpha/beta hydrolase [Gammaproteobacteria bacterium]